MHRIDTVTAVAVMPAPDAPGTSGYFTKGNPGPGTPVPATNLDADWCNTIQEELMSIMTAAGVATDKTRVDQLLTAIQKLGRIKLTANTSFYVSITGNDGAGTGLSVGSPWATIQHAVDVIRNNYDLNGFVATIQLADSGTAYAGANLDAPFVGAKDGFSVVLNGNAATPANTIVTGPVAVRNGGKLKVQNFKIGGPLNGFDASNSGILSIGVGMQFGACTGAHMYANTGGRIVLQADYTIAAGAAAHFQAGSTGTIINGGIATITLAGTPAFGVAFVNTFDMGAVIYSALAFVGGATGTRYTAQSLSLVQSGGGGANYFPGNSAGATAGGAQYL